MSLIVRLEQEVREAMLARDTARRDALRLILSSLKSAEKDLQRPLSDEEELQVLQRERRRARRSGSGTGSGPVPARQTPRPTSRPPASSATSLSRFVSQARATTAP